MSLTELALAIVGLAMLIGLIVLSGAIGGGDDARARRRWEARFERDAHELRRTDATGMVLCRHCGANVSERAGSCPKCGERL